MTYRRVETPKTIEHENGATFSPKVTIANEYGGRYHVALDDNCYVLCWEDPQTGLCKAVPHIFPEAFDVLRTMPPLTAKPMGNMGTLGGPTDDD